MDLRTRLCTALDENSFEEYRGRYFVLGGISRFEIDAATTPELGNQSHVFMVTNDRQLLLREPMWSQAAGERLYAIGRLDDNVGTPVLKGSKGVYIAESRGTELYIVADTVRDFMEGKHKECFVGMVQQK